MPAKTQTRSGESRLDVAVEAVQCQVKELGVCPGFNGKRSPSCRRGYGCPGSAGDGLEGGDLGAGTGGHGPRHKEGSRAQPEGVRQQAKKDGPWLFSSPCWEGSEDMDPSAGVDIGAKFLEDGSTC